MSQCGGERKGEIERERQTREKGQEMNRGRNEEERCQREEKTESD